MGKYTEDSMELLELVGGKDNIAAVSHCMTRMRFVLGDPKKADVKRIEAMKAVKGSFTQAGQFQVIIGNTVAEFYQDFMSVAGIEGVSKDAVKQAAQRNQNILQRAAAIAAEIFAPLIPAIITGGLILGFRNCIDQLYLFENGTKTLVELSQFWAGVDHFLWLIGEAVFHVGIPVGICWSVVRKMGGTPILGIILGLTLVSGQLLNAYAVATTPTDKIPHWDFGYFTVDMIGYQAQVLPAILAALTLVYLERFFKRLVPSVVQMIVVPFCSLVLAVCAAHFVLGPIGWAIGSACAAVLCVSTGTTANAIGVGGIPGILSMQPQTMPTFAMAMMVAIAVPFVLTAIVGKKKGIDKQAQPEAAETAAAEENVTVNAMESEHDFTAFLDGEVISLKEVGDGVFSEGIVGEGLAIRPISETLCAPVSGKITMLMEDSRHAVGMTLSNGVEILLHVGIDTVDMQGDGFSYLVHTGDEVKAGTPLLTFSREKIRAAGHPDVTICVITNKNGVETFAFHTSMAGKTGETVIASF